MYLEIGVSEMIYFTGYLEGDGIISLGEKGEHTF